MKILASDFDLTLFVLDENVVAKNVSAIQKFISAGNLFCIITGRSYSDIKVLLNQYQIPYSYLLCEDGAKIFNSVDYCIDTVMLDGDLVSKIISILEEDGWEYILDDGYNVTTNVSDCVKVFTEYQDREKAIMTVSKLKEKLDVFAYLSSSHINIISSSVNKANSLKKLLQIEQISFPLYVIGDSVNDFEMIQEFDGVVMKNHSPVLDSLHKKEYEFLSDYIEELSKD